ncbi:hypothetical protein DRP05_07240 [Archaeoglobales archaeon]|nr:MAG: hypothetical protein DRP05_07240 [Archaeoglobales archaeon]
MQLKIPDTLLIKFKKIGIKDGFYQGRIDDAEFSIEISNEGDFPVIIKDGIIEILDEVVSKAHLNADKEYEVDLAPVDDYSKRYNKDRFAIVII